MHIISKAPGRVCLFGDHQDYLTLPIIACAIDRYVTITGAPNDKGFFQISMPDIGEAYELHFDKSATTPHTYFLNKVLTVVSRYGCFPTKGYHLTLTSDVPINAGLSSSSAVVVAWAHWLLHTYGCNQIITQKLIGQIAYEAEVLESKTSGGKMDQYTSAIGSTIFLETDHQSKVTLINNNLEGLIIGESGVPKDTEGLLGDLKGHQLGAIATVTSHHPDFSIHKATLEEYEIYKTLLTPSELPYFYAAIKNHLITQEAFLCFRESVIDPITIGRLMTAHHIVLKESLKITVPRIDAMISAALKAGAYGAKIVGSGGGGSICAIAPKGREEEVIEAIKNAGALDAYQVKISKGTHIV